MTGHVIRVIRIGHKKFLGFNLLSVFAHCQNRIGLSSIGDIVIISQILYIASVKRDIWSPSTSADPEYAPWQS